MASSSASDSPGRWQRLEALFYEALELKPEARAEFLDKNCDGDTELRKEVETLLDSAEKPFDFLEKPVLEAARRMVGDPPPANIGPGSRLAHYEIISMLGAGGMGEVYLAEDMQLRRKVAIKMLAPELTRDERGLRRFRTRSARGFGAQPSQHSDHSRIRAGEWHALYRFRVHRWRNPPAASGEWQT